MRFLPVNRRLYLAAPLALLSSAFISLSYADSSDSTKLANILAQTKKLEQQKYVSYVNTNLKDCSSFQTSPMVIIAGSGGGNMDVTCPKEKPVLYKWRFESGFGGWPYIAGGGGKVYVTCCPVSHKWASSA